MHEEFIVHIESHIGMCKAGLAPPIPLRQARHLVFNSPTILFVHDHECTIPLICIMSTYHQNIIGLQTKVIETLGDNILKT